MFEQQSVFVDNFEILRQNLNDGCGDYPTAIFRPIEEIPPPYQEIFAGYPTFNIIQSKVIDDAYYTDNSLVISAPTGSGKTTIFELAIVRLLLTLEKTPDSNPFKIVYICPMKALCEERLVDWHRKFSNFGINAISVTGDSDIIDFQHLLNHNLIITTPEKWDCLTRKWRDNAKLVRIIKLFLIDEIHLLNQENRGSVLETIVCRMKTIEESINPLEDNYLNHKIRFVAVSATVPNIENVAEWIGNSADAKFYKFSDEYRPVKLKIIVLGYSEVPNSTPFKFDLALNYKLSSLIKQHSHGKPTLIFCSTRKIVEMTARHILQHLTINLKCEQKQRLIEASSHISDVKVKETLIHGVGYHHAGMLPETRRVIENLFRNSELPILVTTSTLAMGVNLPAHLVIIKSTKYYANGGFKDYEEIALSQMIGRAGRPQFDTEATALILTTQKDKEKFEKMIGGLQPIESNLHRHLIEHLNAEVVLQTITDLEVAMRWLSSTFLYIRARKNPKHYGLTSSDPAIIDRRLLEMCQIELNKLIKAGMLTIDSDVLLRTTTVGSAMAKYYLAFETMKLFTEINGFEILQQILALISKCHEFSEMYLRVNDKKCLNLLNKCQNGQTIRFPLSGKIKTLNMKINCIIQAVLGCLDICDHSLLSEALKIMRNGERIVKCLIEYLETKNKCFQALLSTIILAKCFHVKLWENSPYVGKQLAGIGNVMSSQLVQAGKTNFKLIAQSDPLELEIIINKKSPAGSKILEQVQYLPNYHIKLELYGKNKIKLSLSLENALDLQQKSTVNRNSLMFLLVGDTANNILLYEKYSHSFFIESPDVNKIIDIPENYLEDIEAHFISEDWVGIDCMTKFELAPKKRSIQEKSKKAEINKKNKTDLNTTYMQTFIDMYVKCKKKREVVNENKAQILKNKEVNENSEKITESVKEHNSNVKTNDSLNNNKIIIHSNISILDNDIKKTETIENENKQYRHYQKSSSATTPENVSLCHPTSFSTINKQTSLNDGLSCGYAVDSIRKNFQFTPKKMTHKRSFELETLQNSETKQKEAEPPVKKQNVDQKSKSQTKITWRSPLTYSPPVKFSPKINFNHTIENSENEGLNISKTSSTTSNNNNHNQVASKIFNRSFTSYASKTTSKMNTSLSKIIFPLSDKDAADSSVDENSDRRSEILEKIGDVASASFLENFGLISPIQPHESQIKTPNEYYHQLLSQSRDKENDKTQQFFFSSSQNNFKNKHIEENGSKNSNTSGFYSALQSGTTSQTSLKKYENSTQRKNENFTQKAIICITPEFSEIRGEDTLGNQNDKLTINYSTDPQDSFHSSQPSKLNLETSLQNYGKFEIRNNCLNSGSLCHKKSASLHLQESPYFRNQYDMSNQNFNQTVPDSREVGTFSKNQSLVGCRSIQRIQTPPKILENHSFELLPSTQENMYFTKRHSSQEYHRNLLEEELLEDDPFNDSFDKVLMEFNIPSQFERQNSNRRSSFTSIAFEDFDSLKNSIEDVNEEKFDTVLEEYENRNRYFNQTCTPAFLSDSNQVSKIQYLPQTKNLQRSTIPFFKRNRNEFDINLHQLPQQNRHYSANTTYQSYDGNHNLMSHDYGFARDGPQFYETPRRVEAYRPFQRCHSSENNSYRYLRQVMENNYETVPRYVPQNYIEPERLGYHRFANVEYSDKENYPENCETHFTSPIKEFSVPIVTPSSRMITPHSEIYRNYHDRSGYGLQKNSDCVNFTDKNYIMQKFLSSREDSSDFYS